MKLINTIINTALATLFIALMLFCFAVILSPALSNLNVKETVVCTVTLADLQEIHTYNVVYNNVSYSTSTIVAATAAVQQYKKKIVLKKRTSLLTLLTANKMYVNIATLVK